MLKHIKNRFLNLFLFAGIAFISCEWKSMHDLFPLEVGNEFYYWHYETACPVARKQYGVETWKVISELSQGDSTIYTIEQNLKATYIMVSLQDTFYAETTYNFEIIERHPSSIISFSGFKFMRYQNVSHLELNRQGSSSISAVTCLFKSNKGLVKYTYNHPNHIKSLTLTLDSLKISQ